MYECSEHTIEPSRLAAVCTALDEVGKRGVHIIWAEFEEFMYVDRFSLFTRWTVTTIFHPDRKRQRQRFWMQLNTG